MAAGRIPAPGTALGPCSEPCQHTDCAANREMAERPCDICGEPIGYERGFFQRENWQKLTHAACEYDREPDAAAARGGGDGA